MFPDECPECEGFGYIVVPVCCGRPHMVCDADPVTGEPIPIGEECCGSPEVEQQHCGACEATGKRRP